MESLLTEDGQLIITAKVKGAENIKERVINIQREEKPKEGGSDDKK